LRRLITWLALLLAYSAGAAPATNAAAPFKLSPGWRLDLVAQAPAISAPSVICCSPDGRIFVGQDIMDMAGPVDKPVDRILCIDTNGKIKVFATNLYAVFGMQYVDGKLYVHHTPKFSVFDDDNGVGVNRKDLIASDNPHPWQPSFNDHIPSGIRLAMDGYFYITTGDKGILNAVGTDGRTLTMRGGIYRMRRDGTGLEVYCTGTRNCLEPAINAEDEIFTYDNTDDGGGWWKRETHMVDGGYYGYPFDFKPQEPYTLWMMTDWDHQVGAPTGNLSYNEDALPEEYHGNLFQCDWSCATVNRVILKRNGSTYDAVTRFNFKHDGDRDWLSPGSQLPKPVGITVTPDGKGFYVTDWAVNAWKTGDVVGHIYKLTYTNATFAKSKPGWFVPAALGQKFHATTGSLVRALSHPAQSVRMVAQRRLAERGPAAEGKLASLVKNKGAQPCARWHAIWTLDAIDGGVKERNVIVAALNDKDPTVQSQAARELGTRQAKEAVGPLIVMLDSTNAMLRFRAATALGRIGDRRAVMPLRLALAQQDLFARYAAFKALNRIGLADPQAWPEIVMGMDSVNPRIREGAFFAVRETYDPALVKALAAFLAIDTIPTEPRTNVLKLLSTLALKAPPWNGDWWNTMPVNSPAPARTEKWEGTPIVAAAMRDSIQDSSPAMRQIAFDWVRSSHDTNAAKLLTIMFERETDAAMRASIIRALPAVDDPASHALVASILEKSNSPVPLVDAAVDAAETMGGNQWNKDMIRLAEHPPSDDILNKLVLYFGKNKVTGEVPFLGKYLTSPNAGLRQNASSSLITIGGDAAISQFLPGLNDKTVDMRRQSISALGSMKAKQAIPQLIKLTADKDVATPAIQALTQMPDMSALDVYLDGLASKNAALRSQCKIAVTALRDAALTNIEARVLSTNSLPDDTLAALKDIYQTTAAAKKGPIFKVRIKQIPVIEYMAYTLDHPGNAFNGRRIFTDANGVNCVRCHRIAGRGALIGPDLDGLRLKQTRAQIIESVLYPSKVILDGYQQVYFTMKNDDDFSGIIRAENNDTITLLDSMGATNVLKKSEVRKRKTSQVSLMPEGLQTGLSKEEFADLISFLENPNPNVPVNQSTLLNPPAPKPAPAQAKQPDGLDFLELPPLPTNPREEAVSPAAGAEARHVPMMRPHPRQHANRTPPPFPPPRSVRALTNAPAH
jgi:putative heme-binding domain-containing protein